MLADTHVHFFTDTSSRRVEPLDAFSFRCSIFDAIQHEEPPCLCFQTPHFGPCRAALFEKVPDVKRPREHTGSARTEVRVRQDKHD